MFITPQLTLDNRDAGDLWLTVEHAARIPFGDPALEELRLDFVKRLEHFARRAFLMGREYATHSPQETP